MIGLRSVRFDRVSSVYVSLASCFRCVVVGHRLTNFAPAAVEIGAPDEEGDVEAPEVRDRVVIEAPEDPTACARFAGARCRRRTTFLSVASSRRRRKPPLQGLLPRRARNEASPIVLLPLAHPAPRASHPRLHGDRTTRSRRSRPSTPAIEKCKRGKWMSRSFRRENNK